MTTINKIVIVQLLLSINRCMCNSATLVGNLTTYDYGKYTTKYQVDNLTVVDYGHPNERL